MMIIIVTVFFILCEIMGQKEQLNDLIIFSQSRLRNTRWKGWENMQKLFFFCGIAVGHFFKFQWQDLLLAAGISIAFFEIGTNTIGLHRHWLFVGASSKFDKLGNWKWAVVFGILLFTILIKIYV